MCTNTITKANRFWAGKDGPLGTHNPNSRLALDGLTQGAEILNNKFRDAAKNFADFRLRAANETDFWDMGYVSLQAYKDDPLTRALFPPLHETPRTAEEEQRWREECIAHNFHADYSFFVVAVGSISWDETEGRYVEGVIGWAEWKLPTAKRNIRGSGQSSRHASSQSCHIPPVSGMPPSEELQDAEYEKAVKNASTCRDHDTNGQTTLRNETKQAVEKPDGLKMPNLGTLPSLSLPIFSTMRCEVIDSGTLSLPEDLTQEHGRPLFEEDRKSDLSLVEVDEDVLSHVIMGHNDEDVASEPNPLVGEIPIKPPPAPKLAFAQLSGNVDRSLPILPPPAPTAGVLHEGLRKFEDDYFYSTPKHSGAPGWPESIPQDETIEPEEVAAVVEYPLCHDWKNQGVLDCASKLLIERVLDEHNGEDKHWCLKNIVVLPQYRHRKVATYLIQWGIQAAFESNDHIFLLTGTPAEGLFQHLGFEGLGSAECLETRLSAMVCKPFYGLRGAGYSAIPLFPVPPPAKPRTPFHVFSARKECEIDGPPQQVGNETRKETESSSSTRVLLLLVKKAPKEVRKLMKFLTLQDTTSVARRHMRDGGAVWGNYRPSRAGLTEKEHDVDPEVFEKWVKDQIRLVPYRRLLHSLERVWRD
ncbi:hypothetical protein B0T17DRAFT_255026 [Bombardia bombarda]|uniref:N-acetyltransferase domain-containing protein n=1 Tax=Bombardia bombarda TaxID=252184 RepID=A0AA39X0R4_9PEZI|nr:hypothetical protein B0T17DRAFT_255026 [Bombardia bombarda]